MIFRDSPGLVLGSCLPVSVYHRTYIYIKASSIYVAFKQGSEQDLHRHHPTLKDDGLNASGTSDFFFFNSKRHLCHAIYEYIHRTLYSTDYNNGKRKHRRRKIPNFETEAVSRSYDESMVETGKYFCKQKRGKKRSYERKTKLKM